MRGGRFIHPPGAVGPGRGGFRSAGEQDGSLVSLFVCLWFLARIAKVNEKCAQRDANTVRWL